MKSPIRGSHLMRHVRCQISASIMFSTAIVLTFGCRGEVPTASAPAQTARQSAEVQDDKAKPEEPAFELESGFKLMSRGDFESFGAEPDTWSITDDGIGCTGKPRGYLYSKEPYRNFTLRLEYRFPRPENLKDDSKFKGNTGFLIYINGEHKLWPSSIEVQGKFVQMAAIKENGDAPPIKSEIDEAARQKARRPVGQWNAIEIVSNSGALSVTLNGTRVSSSQPGSLMEGSIGIQSEDFPFEVRRIRIRTE